MKKFILIVSLLLSHAAFTQRVNQCGIIIPPQRTTNSFSSVYEARDHINTMLDSINWKENFTIQEQYGIDNAYATIIRNRRYILYDNNFLENLDAYARTEWASISVLAHETGHHYRNHVIDSRGSTPPKEIEADYFSGYVLARQDRINAITKATIAGLSLRYLKNRHHESAKPGHHQHRTNCCDPIDYLSVSQKSERQK